MLLKVAETAGFCYGVRRAISIAEEEAPRGCFVLGELIHNRREMDRLAKLGLRRAASVEEIPAGETVLIRSHGEPDSVLHALEEKGCRVVDATCPNVSRIHRIVREASQNGRLPIVIGDRDHPEVRGIVGSAPEVVVLKDEEETEKWLRSGAYGPETPITVVFQTTEIREHVKKCADSLKKVYTNQEKFDTICDATFSRQKEATGLSAICDAMLVVGDRSSANTRRLAEICASRCPKVIFAEKASELDLSDLKDVRTLGVTAGASTPAWIIKEVCAKMTEELKIEETKVEEAVEEAVEAVEEAAVAAPQESDNAPETFDEMLEKSFKTLNNGDKVTGIVAADEEVPRAVKYAGSILPSSLNGLRLTIPPARQYWNTSRRIWRAKITPIMDMNTLITCMACPVWVMLRNMPKMYTGSNGMITTSMALTIMSLNSDARFFSPLEPKNAIPNPSRKANTRADITSTIGGMLMVKYGSRFSNPSATS